MASATFTYLSGRSVGSVTTLTYPKSTITQVGYSKIQPTGILPFRVQFTNTQIVGYDQNNPAPLGVAVIGQNFYIL
jgi:hypothetical protein